MSKYGRRAGDRKGLRRAWYWWTEYGSHLFLVIIAGFVLLAVTESHQAVVNQTKGRRAANAVSCATTSAIIDAGRQIVESAATSPGDRIVNGHVVSGELARFLEAHGFPGPRQRSASAQLAAHQYAEFIAARVIADTRVAGIIRPDGSLDCTKLLKVARL